MVFAALWFDLMLHLGWGYCGKSVVVIVNAAVVVVVAVILLFCLLLLPLLRSGSLIYDR